MRDPHDEVYEPGDDGVGAPPADGGSACEREGDDRGHRRRYEADDDGGGQPRDGSREHVATHPVRAEGMSCGRSDVLGGEIRDDGVVCQHEARGADEREHRRARGHHGEQRAAPRKGPRSTGTWNSVMLAMGSPRTDPGVDDALEDVGDEVADEHDQGRGEGDADQKRGVAAERRRDSGLPRAPDRRRPPR